MVDDVDDFLEWKRQFEEEKASVGFDEATIGIGSANTTNTTASERQRLMVIGAIQDPPPEDYSKSKVNSMKGSLNRMSHGNTICKHLELVRTGQNNGQGARVD